MPPSISIFHTCLLTHQIQRKCSPFISAFHHYLQPKSLMITSRTRSSREMLYSPILPAFASLPVPLSPANIVPKLLETYSTELYCTMTTYMPGRRARTTVIYAGVSGAYAAASSSSRDFLLCSFFFSLVRDLAGSSTLHVRSFEWFATDACWANHGF